MSSDCVFNHFLPWIYSGEMNWRNEAQCGVSFCLSPTVSQRSQHSVLYGPGCAEQRGESHVCGLIFFC